MRKSFLTLMLAIVSSIWTLSNAMCLGPIPDAMYQPYITVSGTIQALPIPCEPGEECPPCLTEAIVTNDKTYYLTTKNQQVADFLEQIQTSPVPAIYLLPLKATASGTPYQMGSFDYLLISSLNELSVEYFSDQQENKLPSLCDEWNVMAHLMALGPEYESFSTYHYRLTSDTIFNDMQYVKFEQAGAYKGAMREGSNRDIYYIPSGSTHEYLLYAFNAKIGDKLENLWFGANENEHYFINSVTVVNIESTTPRRFIIDFEWQSIYTYAAVNDTSEIRHRELVWLEGLGFQYGGPLNYECPFDCSGGAVLSILCAYKNGEQIFTSDLGEQYGCEYNYDPYATPTDTIPLFSYTGDDPGSSTVDPVDPNQVVVTLKGDQLTIHESTGVDVTYSLNHTAPAQVPSHNRAPLVNTFQNKVTIQITESGEYLLQLTNPSWDYIIYGQFYYAPQGIDHITNEPSPITTKVIKNGQIYILRGDIVYTIDGREVK